MHLFKVDSRRVVTIRVPIPPQSHGTCLSDQFVKGPLRIFLVTLLNLRRFVCIRHFFSQTDRRSDHVKDVTTDVFKRDVFAAVLIVIHSVLTTVSKRENHLTAASFTSLDRQNDLILQDLEIATIVVAHLISAFTAQSTLGVTDVKH